MSRWLVGVLLLGCGDVVQPVVDAGVDDADASPPDAAPDAPSCIPRTLEYAPIADEPLNSSPGQPIAQTITPPFDLIVEEIALPLRSCKSNGLVDVRIVIHPTIGANQAPDSTVTVATSSLVANSEILDTCVGDPHEPVTFAFTPTPTLTANTVYALSLQAIGDASGAVSWRRSSTPTDPSDPYPDGTNWSDGGTGSWSQGNDILDLAFSVAGVECE